jgi:hypothetical protein
MVDDSRQAGAQGQVAPYLLADINAVTSGMRCAGAAVIEEFGACLAAEELAAAVYIAMVKQRDRENK